MHLFNKYSKKAILSEPGRVHTGSYTAFSLSVELVASHPFLCFLDPSPCRVPGVSLPHSLCPGPGQWCKVTGPRAFGSCCCCCWAPGLWGLARLRDCTMSQASTMLDKIRRHCWVSRWVGPAGLCQDKGVAARPAGCPQWACLATWTQACGTRNRWGSGPNTPHP